MHFPDESYVRLYTRKTLTNRLLQWQGRAVLHAMLGGEEFDRAGVFNFRGDPVACVATVTGLPEEIVRVGLGRLVETETWMITDSAIVWATYSDAQTCARSDKLRQRESRSRRAASAARPRAAPPPTTDAVTPCHEPSQTVTPNLADPILTDPSLADPDPDRAHECVGREPAAQPDPERATPPPPSTARTIGGVPVWSQYPKGWRWSAETAAAAAAKGVTAAELQEQVNYRTLHPWSVPTNDLDGELVFSLDGIIERRTKARGGGGPPPADPYAWAPLAEHRAFATSKQLPLGLAADAYRAAKRPEALGTLRANEDFMRRIKFWAATGEFIAHGPLRRPAAESDTARGAA